MLSAPGPDAALYQTAAKRIVEHDATNPFHKAPYYYAYVVIEFLRQQGWIDPNEQLTDEDMMKLLSAKEES